MEASDLTILRRRCRLLLRLRDGTTKRDVAEAAGCDVKTIQRDLAWLRSHGVPITEDDRAHAQHQIVYRVPRRWNARAWLWRLVHDAE